MLGVVVVTIERSVEEVVNVVVIVSKLVLTTTFSV